MRTASLIVSAVLCTSVCLAQKGNVGPEEPRQKPPNGAAADRRPDGSSGRSARSPRRGPPPDPPEFRTPELAIKKFTADIQKDSSRGLWYLERARAYAESKEFDN